MEQRRGSSGDLPDPGIELGSPVLQADSLLSEPPGKLKNTGVGSLSLLQGNFPTQELNRGDAIQPSHPLSSPSPPAANPSQHQGLFQ